MPHGNETLEENTETLMMKRRMVVATATLGFLALWENGNAAEKFQKLSDTIFALENVKSLTELRPLLQKV